MNEWYQWRKLDRGEPSVPRGAEAPQRYHAKAMRLWQQLKQEGKVDRTKAYHMWIEHDDWCVIFQEAGRCSCDSDVSLIPHEEPDCSYCQRYGGFPLGIDYRSGEP